MRCCVNVFNCHLDNDTGNLLTEPLSRNGQPLRYRYNPAFSSAPHYYVWYVSRPWNYICTSLYGSKSLFSYYDKFCILLFSPKKDLWNVKNPELCHHCVTILYCFLQYIKWRAEKISSASKCYLIQIPTNPLNQHIWSRGSCLLHMKVR
jgi:hypothetical protein